MANKEEALARLIETTKENLWFIANQPMTKEEAQQVREKIAKPLGVLISKNELSVENNLRHQLQRVNRRKGNE
jgi:hypothetical protein